MQLYMYQRSDVTIVIYLQHLKPFHFFLYKCFYRISHNIFSYKSLPIWEAFTYFVFLDGRCANALPAAVFDFALVLPSRSTADAALAALADVCFEFFITQILLSTNTKNRKGAHLTTKKFIVK